jgi:hypothetical protein
MKKFNNLIINKLLNEEERIPQKMDHLLDKKDFEDYNGKISQSLKSLEAAFADLKKVVDAQKMQVNDIIAKMKNFEMFKIELVAESYPKVKSDLGLIFDRLETLKDVLDFNGLGLPNDSPMDNRGGRGRGRPRN